MSERNVDFDLLFETLGQRYRVRVLGAPGVTADFDPLATSDDEDNRDETPARDTLRDVRTRPARSAPRLRAIGKALFAAVFQGKVETMFRLALQRAKDADARLRLRLRLAEAPALEALPWEALFDPDAGQFLALSPRISVVRYRQSPRSAEPLRVEPPLRVLAVLASPEDEAALAAEEEWKLISRELEPLCDAGRVRLDRLREGTVTRLAEYLENETCHVLHFIGHGTFDPRSGEGSLLLEGDGGASESVTDHRLATALQRHGRVRLAILNACHGARASADDEHAGLTRTLLRLGVPAVVAMRSRIRDRAAVFFAQRFYRHLGAGRSIEGAVSEARKDLHTHLGGTAWATPVLALGAEDSDLLTIAGEPVPVGPAKLPVSRSRRGWTLAAAAAFVVGLAITQLWPWSPPPQHLIPTIPAEGPSSPATEAPLPAPPVEGPCALVPELGIELALVRSGVVSFETARDETDGRDPLVLERDLCFGVTEVTQAQWRKVLPGEPNPSKYIGDDRPVDSVTRSEAQAFVAAANVRLPGAPCRLPTGEEWEYAARAGSKDAYFFGDDSDQLEAYGNCRSRSGRDGFDGTSPVASFDANSFGLFDVHGNVWEWVADELPDDPDRGILRGGSYESRRERCAASASTAVLAERRRKSYGFRIVCEPPDDGEDQAG